MHCVGVCFVEASLIRFVQFQVKQKKYEVLDKKKNMNGIVTITKVTNSLSVANNNEYNQVLQK